MPVPSVPASRPPARGRGLNFGLRQAIIVAAGLVLWQVLVQVSGVSPLLVPSPLAVVRKFMEHLGNGELLAYTQATLQILVSGVGLGILVALVMTGLSVVIRPIRDVVVTAAAMMNPLPAIAVLPLALLWFGIGPGAVIFVVVNSVVWAMALNANVGFETVPVQLRWVGLNLGLRRWRLIRDVYLPASLPYILTGIRIAWAYGWRTVIAAELVFGALGSQGGLGWMIMIERYNLNTDSVFAGLGSIIVIGLAVEWLFNLIERVTVRKWGMTSTG
ncbi:MAG: ABC transporter permease [Acidobacteria bacterium]|nr:ABC transporter permease [Acidobacteriota bacterium]